MSREYPMVKKVMEDLYQIRPGKLSSHVYLILGDINILIDSGTADDFPKLKEGLNHIGIKPEDVDVVINTHEHFDHIGGNIYLQKHSLIGAYKYAAVKIVYGDDEVTHCRAHGQEVIGYKVHLWMNHEDVIDAGRWFLKVIHTPGHTSGSMCLYEPRKRILFSGDTLFANGVISNIYDSGSLGEYFNSLRRLNTLKIKLLLPGHGWISENIEEDIEKTIKSVINKFPEAERLKRLFSGE